MREIKFRAWNNNTKKIMSPETLRDNSIFALITDLSKDNFLVLPLMDEYPLMQFTGLKDINGVEIYEGDVISCCINYQNNIHVSGILVWSGVNLFIQSKSDIMYSFGGASHIEVIGNIYENKELINVQ